MRQRGEGEACDLIFTFLFIFSIVSRRVKSHCLVSF